MIGAKYDALLHRVIVMVLGWIWNWGVYGWRLQFYRPKAIGWVRWDKFMHTVHVLVLFQNRNLDCIESLLLKFSLWWPLMSLQNSNKLTKDYTNSTLHRYQRTGSKNLSNIYPPSATLHLSNIPWVKCFMIYVCDIVSKAPTVIAVYYQTKLEFKFPFDTGTKNYQSCLLNCAL